MNWMQWVVLGFGIIFIALLWGYNLMFVPEIDAPYLSVVSVCATGLTLGFIFSFKNPGK